MLGIADSPGPVDYGTPAEQTTTDSWITIDADHKGGAIAVR